MPLALTTPIAAEAIVEGASTAATDRSTPGLAILSVQPLQRISCRQRGQEHWRIIRSVPKAVPALRAWHLFRKRHADRCRNQQAGLVLRYLGLEPRRDLPLRVGQPPRTLLLLEAINPNSLATLKAG